MVQALGARHVRGALPLLAFSDFEGNDIADFELGVCHTLQLTGVEEKILRLAFASDESESLVRKPLDSSCHDFILLLETRPSSCLDLTCNYMTNYSLFPTSTG